MWHYDCPPVRVPQFYVTSLLTYLYKPLLCQLLKYFFAVHESFIRIMRMRVNAKYALCACLFKDNKKRPPEDDPLLIALCCAVSQTPFAKHVQIALQFLIKGIDNLDMVGFHSLRIFGARDSLHLEVHSV